MIFNTLLTKKVLSEYKREFLLHDKVKHIVIDDFLSSQVYENILSEIQSKKKNIMGDTQNRQIVYVGGAASHKLQDVYTSEYFSKFLSFFYDEKVFPEYEDIRVGFMPILYTKIVYGKGFFYRRNLPGSFLDWHTDGPFEKVSGSFILYLNDDWRPGDGGELQLGIKKDNSIEAYKTIEPVGNRLVLLKCEEDISWHRVLPSEKNRYFIHDQLLKK